MPDDQINMNKLLRIFYEESQMSDCFTKYEKYYKGYVNQNCTVLLLKQISLDTYENIISDEANYYGLNMFHKSSRTGDLVPSVDRWGFMRLGVMRGSSLMIRFIHPWSKGYCISGFV